MHQLTLRFCWNLSQYHKTFPVDVWLYFHPSHNSGRATQNGHTQTKLRGKPTDVESPVQSSPIQ
jgi:hypothetical protein